MPFHKKMPFSNIPSIEKCPFLNRKCPSNIIPSNALQCPFKLPLCMIKCWRACPSILYHTKRQFERALKGIWRALWKNKKGVPCEINVDYLKGHALHNHIIQKFNMKGHWRAFDGVILEGHLRFRKGHHSEEVIF